ncbi:MAG: phosphohistidine phosphatase SixA [Anaerolineales bacterium]|nr:phosphohistidine phosphatase SixA [Anaerolineales bacterium]
MHLYFVRHGLANWPSWPGNDAERPLTSDGLRRMEAAARGLAKRDLKLDLILHSPYLRAAQTADIIAQQLALTGAMRGHHLLQPGFNLKALKHVLKEHGKVKGLMLVGHAPDMSEVVTELAGESVRFKEGTVACVKLKDSGKAKLLWLATAEELAEE